MGPSRCAICARVAELLGLGSSAADLHHRRHVLVLPLRQRALRDRRKGTDRSIALGRELILGHLATVKNRVAGIPVVDHARVVQRRRDHRRRCQPARFTIAGTARHAPTRPRRNPKRVTSAPGLATAFVAFRRALPQRAACICLAGGRHAFRSDGEGDACTHARTSVHTHTCRRVGAAQPHAAVGSSMRCASLVRRTRCAAMPRALRGRVRATRC